MAWLKNSSTLFWSSASSLGPFLEFFLRFFLESFWTSFLASEKLDLSDFNLSNIIFIVAERGGVV